jgi:hypothetical protein
LFTRLFFEIAMDSERIEKSLQSAMQLLAARDAVQEVVDALEALAEGRMPDPRGLQVDAEGRGSSRREGAAGFEMLNGTTLLTMLLGDGSSLCREQAKKLAANLRDFAGANKSP